MALSELLISRDYKAELTEVSTSVKRIADFQIRGIVPDDLKDSCGREHRPNPGRFSEVYSLGRGRH
jgi:hypothetical protein